MDTQMDFELTMRTLFGKKAYHIASAEMHPLSRRKWLQKAVRQLMHHVENLDTTVRHKHILMVELDGILKAFKGVKEPSWSIVYRLLRLCFRLFGYDYLKGARTYTPTYWQTSDQYYTSHILEGGDVMQNYADEKDVISVRHEIVRKLKEEGLSDFKISLILNTSEYEVKQLKKMGQLT